MPRAAAAIAAVLLLAVGPGAAADPGAAPFDLRGSDTLRPVLEEAFAAYQAECGAEPWFAALRFAAGGSSGGAGALTRAAPDSGYPWQLNAPMARNLTAAELARCPDCAPEQRNVLGLDALVVLTRSQGLGYVRCPDLRLGTGPADPHRAPADNLLALILGGKGGLGTLAACSHPDRLAALEALRRCATGVLSLQHWFRPDDGAGAGDLLRERLGIRRFCNGAAPGPGNADNGDLDPVRRPCPPGGPDDLSRRRVRCTFTDPADAGRFGQPCHLTPFEPGCTAGFVVALSEADPGLADATATIAERVGRDPTFGSLGHASRRAARLPERPAAAPTVNGIVPSDPLIRSNAYLLSRRLWLHDRVVQAGRSLNPSLSCADPDSTALPPSAPGSGCLVRDRTEGFLDAAGTAGGFFFWATDPLPSLRCASGPGRQRLGPILRAHGLVPCAEGDLEPSDPNALCGLQDGPGGVGYAAAADPEPALVVNPASGGTWLPAACTAPATCWSDGSTCAAGGSCPAPPRRPAGHVCSAGAECLSGSCDGFAGACR